MNAVVITQKAANAMAALVASEMKRGVPYETAYAEARRYLVGRWPSLNNFIPAEAPVRWQVKEARA